MGRRSVRSNVRFRTLKSFGDLLWSRIALTILGIGAPERDMRSRSRLEGRAIPPTSSYTGKNRLLKALPREDFARLFSGLEPVSLPLRQVIQDAAEPVEWVYFVEQGVTSILTIMSDASAIEVGMIGTEGMVGIASLLDDFGTSRTNDNQTRERLI
jgi:CRP-like cAMP-binding protein